MKVKQKGDIRQVIDCVKKACPIDRPVNELNHLPNFMVTSWRSWRGRGWSSK